jgi:hypothetical protein
LFLHNQTYFVTNDQSHSSDKHDPDKFRDSVAGYVHYRENGTIAPVVINGQGVGEYDLRTTWPEPDGEIQAENYFRLIGAAEKREMSLDDRSDFVPGTLWDEFDVRIAGGSLVELHYPKVRLDAGVPVSTDDDNFAETLATSTRNFGLRLRLRTMTPTTAGRIRATLGTRSTVSCILPPGVCREGYGWVWLPLSSRTRRSAMQTITGEDLVIRFDLTGESTRDIDGDGRILGRDMPEMEAVAKFDKWTVGVARDGDRFCSDANFVNSLRVSSAE